MKVKIDKSFEKDIDGIRDKKLLQKVSECIQQVMTTNTQDQISNLKKLQGFRNHYRVRIGDYRAGIIIKNEVVIFERLLHRKDIYKYYP